jgi:hypothetical protein
MFEDSLCRCGHSAFIAHGENGVGEYDAKPTTCHACKEAERASRDDDRSPGRVVSVRALHDDERRDDDELPDHSGIDV